MPSISLGSLRSSFSVSTPSRTVSHGNPNHRLTSSSSVIAQRYGESENIIISDISSLRNRVLMTILPNTLPGCLNVWVGGDVAGKVLETT